jgi:uncharacterized sulfatase
MHKLIIPLSITALLAFSCGQQTKEIQEQSIDQIFSKPNIIFILADDLGYGDLGCYGQERIKTPRIDQMATEGMLFTHHYAGSTVCAPSRSALMTGMDTGHTRIRGNATVPLRQEDETVAEVLKKAGYQTGLVGKWGLGEAGSTGVPNKQGFDFFYGYLNQIRAHNSYPDYLWRNDQQELLPNEIIVADEGYAKGIGSVSTNKEVHSHDLFTKEALKFIEEKAGNPFFLYLAYTIPHANNEYWLLDEHGMEVPDLGEYADKDWPEVEKAKASMISRLDGDVGRILDLLKQKGIDDNTLVIFSSDNGPHAEGTVDPDFFDSNKPFRGIKRDLYDGGVRIPMIAWWPGKIEAGKTSNHRSAFWDFLPTCAELAGVKASDEVNGISYLPMLLGNASAQKKHDILYWEFPEQGKKQAVLVGKWKLVYLLKDNRYELYHLSEDVDESENLIEQNPEIFQELKEKMEKARTASEDFPF